MQWTLQRKVSAGLVGAAVIWLAIDQGLVFSGGSDAAAAVEGQAPSAEQLIARAPEAPTGATLASTLERVAGELPVDNERDLDGPMAAPSGWPSEKAPAPVEIAAPKVKPGTYRLSSVMAGGNGQGYAVINGTLVQVGAEINGATLQSVGAEHAVLRVDGGEIRLEIEDGV